MLPAVSGFRERSAAAQIWQWAQTALSMTLSQDEVGEIYSVTTTVGLIPGLIQAPESMNRQGEAQHHAKTYP